MITIQIVQLNQLLQLNKCCTKTIKCENAFAVAQPAAVASNNVNDLITVTKQTIKVGDGKDNVAAAHDGKDIEYDTEFTIDNKVKKAIQ